MRRVWILACLGLAWAGGAQAGLEICNHTGELQSIAIGYKGETDWTSEGWWNIQPDDCAMLVAGDLTKRYYYYHADSRSGGFRGQNFVFCTARDEFTIVGDTDCQKRGHSATEFREIDTGETATSFTLTLTSSRTRAGGGGGGGTVPGGGGETGGGVGTQTVTEAPVETETPVVDEAALESGHPPGRHGEVFETAALFQGCELEGGREYCSFHADGVKLRVFYSGPTPEDMMYALEAMPLNTPVMLTGDMAENRGVLGSVVLRKVQPRRGSDPMAGLRSALQGDWLSESDRDSEITIRGSEIYVRYEGEFQAVRFIELAQSCPGMRGEGPALIQTGLSDLKRVCYRVVKASGNVIELEPVRGGARLRFRRGG